FTRINPTRVLYRNDSNIVTYYGVNQSIFSYYKYFYRNSISNISNKRILVEANGNPFYLDYSDIGDVDNWTMDEFKRNNLISYELIFPASYDISKLDSIMIQDFDRYLSIKSKIEKRK